MYTVSAVLKLKIMTRRQQLPSLLSSMFPKPYSTVPQRDTTLIQLLKHIMHFLAYSNVDTLLMWPDLGKHLSAAPHSQETVQPIQLYSMDQNMSGESVVY